MNVSARVRNTLLAAALLTVGAPLAVTPATASTADDVAFRADAETGDWSQWCFEHSAVDVDVVTSPVRDGRYSYKTEVRDGASIYGTERSEYSNGPASCNKHVFTEGQETWTAISVHPAANFPKYTHWSLVTQWKEPYGGTPPQQINLQNDTWSIVGSDSISPRPRWNFGTIQRGQWNDFVVHQKWSTDAKVGFVEVYLNGKLALPKTYTRTMNNSNPVFLSVGQYRDTAPTSGTAVLHVDAVKVGSSYSAVAPPSSESATSPVAEPAPVESPSSTTTAAPTPTPAPAPAPAVQETAAGTVQFVGGTKASGVGTVKIPTPVAHPGSVLVATVDVRGRPGVTAPAGWRLVRDDINGTSARKLTYTRTISSAEPTAHTWKVSSTVDVLGTITAYSGVHQTQPVAAQSGSVFASTTGLVAPSVTAVAGGTVVTLFSSAARVSISPPAGMTERSEIAVPTTARYQLTSEVSDQRLAEAGATGRRTATTDAGAPGIAQVLVLRPSA